MFTVRTLAAISTRGPGRLQRLQRLTGDPRTSSFSTSSISGAESPGKVERENSGVDGNGDGGKACKVDGTTAVMNERRPSQPQKPADYREAWGTLVRNEVKEIVATFVVEGRLMVFKATMSRGMQPFTSRTAALRYDHKSDLSGEHCVDGTVGNSGFKLKFDNGPSITGDVNLTTSSLNKHDIDGWGSWKKL